MASLGRPLKQPAGFQRIGRNTLAGQIHKAQIVGRRGIAGIGGLPAQSGGLGQINGPALALGEQFGQTCERFGIAGPAGRLEPLGRCNRGTAPGVAGCTQRQQQLAQGRGRVHITGLGRPAQQGQGSVNIHRPAGTGGPHDPQAGGSGHVALFGCLVVEQRRPGVVAKEAAGQITGRKQARHVIFASGVAQKLQRPGSVLGSSLGGGQGEAEAVRSRHRAVGGCGRKQRQGGGGLALIVEPGPQFRRGATGGHQPQRAQKAQAVGHGSQGLAADRAWNSGHGMASGTGKVEPLCFLSQKLSQKKQERGLRRKSIRARVIMASDCLGLVVLSRCNVL